MPRLKGTATDAEIIEYLFFFGIMATEIMNSGLDPKKIIRQHIKKGITNVCWKCAERGYYIVGLESAIADIEENTSWAEKYTFTLRLKVRQFAEPLRQEDVAYWAPQFCERILFEFFQLNNSSSKIKTEIATAMKRIATSTGVADEIRRNETRQRIEYETFGQLKKMFGDNIIKFPGQKIEEPTKWEIINLGASDAEQPDSK